MSSEKRFVGYHEPETLPIKRGDIVTIRKGVMVRCRSVTKLAGRTYKVKVDHVLCGMTRDDDKVFDPSVRWPGSGGYWAEVNINDVVE